MKNILPPPVVMSEVEGRSWININTITGFSPKIIVNNKVK